MRFIGEGQKYPGPACEVFNVDRVRPDVDIFALPYALNGRLVSLGNPTADQIADLLLGPKSLNPGAVCAIENSAVLTRNLFQPASGII
jgi:hypothetical protein